DFVVVNGENAAGGRGLTVQMARDFYAAGVDVLTTGNWVWGQREIIAYIDSDPRLLRPLNFPPGSPGLGAGLFDARGRRKVAVIHVIGRVHMEPMDDPFQAAERALERYSLGGAADAIILDVHGEATSEKQALAHAVDGRVSVVVGSHTHVPTADNHILPGGTAYQSDAGMCGDYNSVIGYDTDHWVQRFVRKLPMAHPAGVAGGEPSLCGLFVETDDATGLARRQAPVRLGGVLSPAWPGDSPPPPLILLDTV
ncbi:MAG: TIGR00282 family metallophosphoesterase, partial [Alphaproteobacteria bacterium]